MLVAAVDARGGLGGIALTHDHIDHSEGVEALRERRPAPLAAGRGEVDVELVSGARFGPFVALATPGHAPDHLALIDRRVCFTGDAVLGEGSVFIAPDPGALTGYLDGLRELRELDLDVLCPGHGPPIWDPRRSSTSTSIIAWSASGCCWRRSPQGVARPPSCSTPRGRTCPPSCAPSPPSRCARTSTSSRMRGCCPPAWSGPPLPFE